jgi:CheY-like chemotaxis protein
MRRCGATLPPSPGWSDEVGDDPQCDRPGGSSPSHRRERSGVRAISSRYVRERGFKGIVTSQGLAALVLASQFKPSAITLDLFLPDIDGWRVLNRLKN